MPWGAVAVGFAAMFTIMGTRTAFGVLYPAMVVDLGWSVSEVTGAFSAGLLVYAPAAVAVGVLVDRIGCRATMLSGCVLLVAGMATAAFATELWHFYVAFVAAIGLGNAAVGFITVIKVLSLRAPSRFAAAFGAASVGQGVGALVVSPTVQAIVEQAGWRAGALAVGGMVALGLLPLVAWLAPGLERASHRRISDSAALPIWTPLFFLFFAANAGLGYQMLLPTHQVAHLIDVGFAPVVAAAVAGLWGALTAVGSVVGGWSLERWGEKRLQASALVLTALGAGALILAAPSALWLVGLFVVAGGAGRGLLSIALATAQTRAFAGPALGRMTGLADLGFGIGAFLGPWLTAVAYDTLGSFKLGIASSIALAAVVVVATSLNSRRMPARS